MNVKVSKNPFTRILKGKVVILGIGNVLRGDDGFGPMLANELNGKVKALCIDGGSAPENYLGKIVRENPDTILMVDAIHLGAEAGKYEILKKSDILESGLTTHSISIKALIEFIEGQISADIFLLGVQPQNLIMGNGLCEPVRNMLTEAARLIREAIGA